MRTKGTRPKGSGIPARGAGWGGGKREPVPFSAENQPSGEAKSAGKTEAATAREIAKAHAVAMAQLMVEIANNPEAPMPTRLDAANKLIERAEGKATTMIGGDAEVGPVRHVVAWEDGE